MNIICLILNNQDLYQKIHVFINYQLPTIFFLSFDCNPTLETRVVFLDISKAFEKVWHKGLLFKLIIDTSV